jgi:carbon monoxide dehydrogenase subunit G
MGPITTTRYIEAPPEAVFTVIANMQNWAEAVPDVVRVEMLSDTTTGVGTRFRETRLMKGKEATTELEVTEYVENERIRIVADTGGTIWDSVHTVTPERGGTELELSMDARPHTFLARLITPFVKPMLGKALAKDLDAVKLYCERN